MPCLSLQKLDIFGFLKKARERSGPSNVGVNFLNRRSECSILAGDKIRRWLSGHEHMYAYMAGCRYIFGPHIYDCAHLRFLRPILGANPITIG